MTRRRGASRQRGVAAVLAMMFLVIFGSLAAAMAIVSQGNLRTAESHLKINRTLAAAETGMALMEYRVNLATRLDDDGDGRPDITTTDGVIHAGNTEKPEGNAQKIWALMIDALYEMFDADIHNLKPPQVDELLADDGKGNRIEMLTVGPIRVGPGEPDFMATFTPHPIPGEDYDSAEYDRLPYGAPEGNPGEPIYEQQMAAKRDAGIPFIVAASTGYDTVKALPVAPLDARFIRLKVTAFDDGGGGNREVAAADGSFQGSETSAAHSRVYRSVQKDYLLTKRIPFALLSRSRIMVGRNVMIDGPIGSHFTEVDLTNGHPVQVLSDFRGLDDDLDDDLDALVGTLITNDIDGDNRINIASSSETAGLSDPQDFDRDGNGYITDFDFFLKAFDSDANGRVSRSEFGTTSDPTREQLFDLINAMSPFQNGTNGDFIDANDFYAKVQGQVSILATKAAWEAGAAGGAYQDHLQGPIVPDHNESPITFDDSEEADLYNFDAADFNIARFAADATTTIADQAAAPIANDAGSPATYDPPSAATRESVPFGAAYPYDYYDRPVYRNMVFENAKIPKGTNALFDGCRFIGVTYVETEPANTDPNYNYAGIQNADGSYKHPDRVVTVDGNDYGGDPNVVGNQAQGTKLISNNLRFHDCTFEGGVVSGNWAGGSASTQPGEYTHVRNKVSFTGNTVFNIDDSTELDDEEKELFKRSTLLLPHFSVEMGSFDEAYASSETVELSGIIVAGLIDMRGQVNVEGTVVTTFEPKSDEGPVVGQTSPQFNTTLGYFDSADGDLEADLPTVGLGKISVRYNANLPLPDGIDGPISVIGLPTTYREGGK